tara:strand:- start:5169 stop:5897 length:729 start_codon:yes stop_codon:yes gene_type:complete
MQNQNDRSVKDAFILAAGFGKRLLPLTEHTPKPLLNINNTPMIEYILDALSSINIRKVHINSHYLSDKIEQYFMNRDSPYIKITKEKKLLDTGGGIKNALKHDNKDPIFVINCDAILLQNYPKLLLDLESVFFSENMDAMLALSKISHAVGYSGSGDFFIDKDGMIHKTCLGNNKFVFMGISILNPKVLDRLDKKDFSLTEIWDQLIENNRCYGFVYDKTWCHTGNLNSLDYANNFFKKNKK